MSRVVYLDCASGASGDMLLGALVDLGLPLEALEAELRKLPLGGYRLSARKVERAGIQATKVDVEVATDEHGHGHGHEHEHEHGHEHEHEHGHEHGPGNGHGRRLGDILQILEHSTLDPEVRARAAALFRRLAEAEAAVHGTSPDDVHFHEVGAVDSIVDIVGGVIGLRWLEASRVVASSLNVGTGTVKIAHGVYPVPPPATARLVAGVPIYGAGEGELLTPTGALLVTAHADSYGPLPALRPVAVGYGAGTRNPPDRPNVLRVVVGDEAAAEGGERVVVLEAEVDDMTPQLCGPLIDRLLKAGALDAFFTPVQMKKGRPGLLISVVAPPARRTALEDLLFAETTTIGLRWQEWNRTVLDRETVPVETPFGAVAVKVARRHGRVLNAQPEFDDCLRLAEARGVPVKEVLAAALSAWRARSPA